MKFLSLLRGSLLTVPFWQKRYDGCRDTLKMAWGCSGVMGSHNAVRKCDWDVLIWTKEEVHPFWIEGGWMRTPGHIWLWLLFGLLFCFSLSSTKYHFLYLSILFACLPNNQMFQKKSWSYTNSKAYTLCTTQNLYRKARQRHTKSLRHIYTCITVFVWSSWCKEKASLSKLHCTVKDLSIAGRMLWKAHKIPVLSSHTAPYKSMSL